MDFSLLFRGILVGCSIAAPVGPIGVLCIRRTLVHGRAAGICSGLGAATADGCYGLLAALGLTALTDVLTGLGNWPHLGGGAFLCYLGVRTARILPSERAAPAGGAGLAAMYGATLLLTLTNPLTILSFAAIFAGLGAGVGGQGTGAALFLVMGVFTGSALWWLALAGVVGLVRGRLTPRSLRVVNLLSGAVLLSFGLATLLSAAAGRG